MESGHIQPQPVEPSLQLQGHTLGVSALDTSDGKIVAYVICLCYSFYFT